MGLEAERAEGAGKRGDVRTLYEITRKISGRFQNTYKPVRNEAGVLLRSAEEEMHRWREHFKTVLNHEEPLNPWHRVAGHGKRGVLQSDPGAHQDRAG